MKTAPAKRFKLNAYFYKLWLPLQILTLVFFVLALQGQIETKFWPIFVVWFLLGPVGIGVGFHRLFSHRQFETHPLIETILAFLGTATGYAPISFWVANHIYHHQHSDEAEDPSSPVQHGWLQSFLTWRLNEHNLIYVSNQHYCVRRIYRNKSLLLMSRHFFKIFWLLAFVFFLMNPSSLWNYFLLPVQIEHFRINLISCFSHLKMPFSYRNHPTPEHSENNLLIAYLTFGFGWHNNHHHDERKLLLTEKWWELDIEGLIGKALSKETHRESES